MSDLEKKKADSLASTALTNPFEAYGKAATARGNIDGTLLKFNKGDYVAGRENEDIPLGTQFKVLMDQLMVGWTRWEDGIPVNQDHMGLVAEGYQPPRRKDLGDTDKTSWERDTEGEPRDPWQFTNYLPMKRADNGELYTFTTNTQGGRGAVGELSKDYGKAIRQRPDQYPIIELDVGSYQHRDRSLGRIKFPILKIVGWTAKDDGNVPSEPPQSPPSGTAAKPAVAKKPATTTNDSAATKPAAAAQPRF